MEPTYFKRPEAAAYVSAQGLEISPNTLQKMATTGGGPLYRRFGRLAVYTRADLDAWLAEKLSAPSRTAAHR